MYYGRGAFYFRRPPTGGFLIQEMGIGKTVEALALVLANARASDDRTSPLGTLVVCPVTLLANWKAECEKLLPKRIKVLILNSAAKKTHNAAKLSMYHLVITAYSLLEHMTYEDFRNPTHHPSPALKVKWRRVIFDESQSVKCTYTDQTRCSAKIDARLAVPSAGVRGRSARGVSAHKC